MRQSLKLKQITFLLALATISIYSLICAGEEISNGKDDVISIRLIFKDLMRFTRYHSTSQFGVTFSATYMPQMESRGHTYNVSKIVNSYVHINELCPDELDKCWCGFANDAKKFDLNLANRNIVFVKMCSSEPIWMQTKNQITVDDFLSLSSVELSNGTTYGINKKFNLMTLEKAQETRRNNSDKSVDIKELWKSLELNKHDESLCPYRYEWCWCGFVGNVVDYFMGKKSTTIVEAPRVMLDCRTFERRLYETRNCTIQSGDSLPWYRKIFGRPKVHFPCGHY